nr:cytochrome b [Volvulina compacta]
MRIHNKIQLLSLLNTHIVVYPTPMNLNYSWNGGSLAGLMLVSQMLTGILLAMHYVGHVDYAFASVQHIMTDVPSGMILRYAHANGASLFFIVVYLHIIRGMYYGSGTQPREMVWITGVVILLLMIITAFIGYVLPWGQMSFWGATVITSLATAIPVVGKSIMYWLWGGFSVDNPTLNRFYSFHYTLPFILAGLSVFHIAALHQYGSTNPLSVNAQSSTLAFGSYFGVKDLLGALFLALVFTILVFFYPDLLGHPDNLIPANPYSTPQHIVPEWYFLWVYAILRSIPNKAMGVLAIGLVFASLFALPFINLGGGKFRLLTEWFFWWFLADVCLLTWLGGCEITPVTSLMGLCCTAFLFAYLLIVLPVLGYLDNWFTNSKFLKLYFYSNASLVRSFCSSKQSLFSIIKSSLSNFTFSRLFSLNVQFAMHEFMPISTSVLLYIAMLSNSYLMYQFILFFLSECIVSLSAVLVLHYLPGGESYLKMMIIGEVPKPGQIITAVKGIGIALGIVTIGSSINLATSDYLQERHVSGGLDMMDKAGASAEDKTEFVREQYRNYNRNQMSHFTLEAIKAFNKR